MTEINAIDLTKEAPETEPARQQYFMSKLKMLVEERAERLGRPLTACVQTFGCQMNARDSEKLLGLSLIHI